MRLTLTLDCPRSLPFDHLPVLTAAFHKWTGNDENLHNKLSLYSLSGLAGGRVSGDRLVFGGVAQWVISAPDKELMERVLGGAVTEPELNNYGLRVTDIKVTPPPALTDGQHRFNVLSPVFVKAPFVKGSFAPVDHLRFNDPRAGEVMTTTFRHKLEAAGLDPEGAAVAFDTEDTSAKFRLQQYRQTTCRVNKCAVLVTGSAQQQLFAWEVGVGNSTGIGFGALR